jgi:hypothetical protein
MKLFLLFITSLTILALGSCYKKENTTANIYVKDEANAFIEDAMVILYGENTTNLPNQVVIFDTLYTNSDGLASFDFNYLYQPGQAGVAVLNIKATSGNKQGIGIIKIEQEKVSEETVFIQP